MKEPGAWSWQMTDSLCLDCLTFSYTYGKLWLPTRVSKCPCQIWPIRKEKKKEVERRNPGSLQYLLENIRSPPHHHGNFTKPVLQHPASGWGVSVFHASLLSVGLFLLPTFPFSITADYGYTSEVTYEEVPHPAIKSVIETFIWIESLYGTWGFVAWGRI